MKCQLLRVQTQNRALETAPARRAAVPGSTLAKVGCRGTATARPTRFSLDRLKVISPLSKEVAGWSGPPMVALLDPLAAAFRLEGSNGEAVVLIHGYTGTPAHFRPSAKELNAAGFTVVAPRLAGHGTSMEDMATTTARDWVESAQQAVATVSDHDRLHLARALDGWSHLARPGRLSVCRNGDHDQLARDSPRQEVLHDTP